MKSCGRYLLILVPALWLGMVLAISMLEAPLKFQAPGITLALGLGIGRIVFAVLNRVEITLMLLTYAGLYMMAVRPRSFVLLHLLAIILLLQTFWLLPVLDTRALAIIQGNPPPESSLHLLYIGLEILKIVLLIATSVTNAKFVFGTIKLENRLDHQ